MFNFWGLCWAGIEILKCKLTGSCSPHASQCYTCYTGSRSTTCRSHWRTSWRLLRKPLLRHMAAKKRAWKEGKNQSSMAVSKHSDHYTPPKFIIRNLRMIVFQKESPFPGTFFKFQGSRSYLVFSNWLNKSLLLRYCICRQHCVIYFI